MSKQWTEINAQGKVWKNSKRFEARNQKSKKRVSLKDVKVTCDVTKSGKKVFYKIHPVTKKKIYGFNPDGTYVQKGSKKVQTKSK